MSVAYSDRMDSAQAVPPQAAPREPVDRCESVRLRGLDIHLRHWQVGEPAPPAPLLVLLHG